MNNLEGILLKIFGGLSLLWKIASDLSETTTLADYITLEKAGVTGLLAFFLWFFMNAYKDARKKFDAMAVEKERMLKELAEEKAKNAILSERILRQDENIRDILTKQS